MASLLQRRERIRKLTQAQARRHVAAVEKHGVEMQLAAVVPGLSEEPALSRETVVVAKSRHKRSAAKNGTHGRRHRKAAMT